jgi:RimJ/RimL family protein N-acetyltransferase
MITPAPITTQRLILRPLTESDAPAIVPLAGAREVADTTLRIPHPYTIQDARQFLGRVSAGYATGNALVMAMALRNTGTLIGATGLEVDAQHRRAELGYWLGVQHWNKGYATEASLAMLRVGFSTLDLVRITAHHMPRNPASGRVLEKIGMQREGVLRQHFRKLDHFEDAVVYGILREEFKPV